MTLTVTPGATNADSYAALSDALAYHAAKGNAAWAASTDVLREPALRRATTWLDGQYSKVWPGRRVNGRTQALDWPRYSVVDADGWVVDYATIPVEIVNATCEAALRELASPGSLSPDYVAADQVASTTAGPVSVTFRQAGGAAAVQPILTVVDGIIARLLGGGSRTSVLMVRA